MVDEMEKLGHQPKLANPHEGRRRMGLTNKTDKLDAKGLRFYFAMGRCRRYGFRQASCAINANCFDYGFSWCGCAHESKIGFTVHWRGTRYKLIGSV